MYAPAHVATALAVKRRFPVAPLFWLMLATQAVEFIWMLLSYLGIEYQSVDARGVLHLDYLPFSHSLLTGIGLPILAYAVIRWGFRRPTLALAVSLAMVSHIIYDVIQHEPNIQIAPGINQPRLGLNLGAIPAADFLVETGIGVVCWWYFGGDWKLLCGSDLLEPDQPAADVRREWVGGGAGQQPLHSPQHHPGSDSPLPPADLVVRPPAGRRDCRYRRRGDAAAAWSRGTGLSLHPE
jgi:hypothetical protein